MFNYPKSTDYNSYSQSCPAVDDRQPIILSTAQFDKGKKKRMDKEEKIKWF